MKNIGLIYNLQPSLLKQQMDHDEIHERTWEDEENEWSLYLENQALSTAFSYARYSKSLEELTGVGMKNNLKLLSLANKRFNSLRDENDETIYTYNDEFLRRYSRQSLKGGHCWVLNQYYKSTISDKVINFISSKLDVNGNLCDILDKYFEFGNIHRKIIENEYDSHFEDSRDIYQEDQEKHGIKKRLSEIPIHEKSQKLDLDNVKLDFYATSLYPSAMWDENSIYPEIEIVLLLNCIGIFYICRGF